MCALLELQDITKSFGGLTAVNNLSFEVDSAEIVGLIGPNGAGKTTAFNTITGVYKPTSGNILFEGRIITGKKPHKIAQVGIARTFQTVRPFSRMTVLENVMMGGLFGRDHTLSTRRARERASEVLDFTSLSQKADVFAGSLSLAEQRRLELARALAVQPKLLMLDEVMAGLNLTEIGSTLDLLVKLNSEKKIALVVIEHVLKAVMRLCTRIVVMDRGAKIAEGHPDDIVNNAKVVEAYLGDKAATSARRTGLTSGPPATDDAANRLVAPEKTGDGKP